jgi:hypothetical protein
VSAGDLAPWLTLVGLGLFHGLNPAMGWLFAVALGLQQKRRAAVLWALPPIAIGHEAAVVAAVVLVRGVELVSSPDTLRLAAGAALVLFGLFKFARPRAHPRWVGMRIAPWELGVWSFLMATAHGAGLMLVPLLLGLHADSHTHALPAVFTGTGSIWLDVAAVLVHTLAMLLTMGAIALVVYEKVGVGILRRAWVNLDALWAAAFVVAGAATLFT